MYSSTRQFLTWGRPRLTEMRIFFVVLIGKDLRELRDDLWLGLQRAAGRRGGIGSAPGPVDAAGQQQRPGEHGDAGQPAAQRRQPQGPSSLRLIASPITQVVPAVSTRPRVNLAAAQATDFAIRAISRPKPAIGRPRGLEMLRRRCAWWYLAATRGRDRTPARRTAKMIAAELRGGNKPSLNEALGWIGCRSRREMGGESLP